MSAAPPVQHARINANAEGTWRHAVDLPVEIVEEFTRTCRVRLLRDFVVDGSVRHKKDAICLIVRDWVSLDGEQQ